MAALKVRDQVGNGGLVFHDIETAHYVTEESKAISLCSYMAKCVGCCVPPCKPPSRDPSKSLQYEGTLFLDSCEAKRRK